MECAGETIIRVLQLTCHVGLRSLDLPDKCSTHDGLVDSQYLTETFGTAKMVRVLEALPVIYDDRMEEVEARQPTPPSTGSTDRTSYT